jgi:hypothetical protein
METVATDHPDGLYRNADDTAVTAGDLVDIESTLAEVEAGLTVTVPADGESYTVAVDSETGNEFQIIRAADGSVTYPCTVGGTAGCPDNDLWAE